MSNQDIWGDVDNPKQRSNDYYGLATLDARHVVLQKGVKGGVPFDPAQHSEDKKSTMVDIVVSPLPEMALNFALERSILAESAEWGKKVLPSIKDIGLNSARELNGKYVHVEMTPSGEMYTNGNGEQKERTYLKFTAVYKDENACRAAFYASKGSTLAADAEVLPMQMPPAAPGADPKKAAMLPFLKSIVKNACDGQKDLAVIQKTVGMNIANIPQLAQLFTVDSPEVTTLIMEMSLPF